MPRPRRKSSPERPAPAEHGVETRVFRSGNSDAVRIPLRFRMSGARVRLRLLGDGRVLVEPIRKRRWPPGFLDSFGPGLDDLEPPPRPAPDPARERRTATLFDDPAT